MSEAPDVILVLGMHRSGTSAYTRVLNLLGVGLGEDLMPAGASNERGFWEPLDLVALHDRLLERLGLTWSLPWVATDRWWRADTVADLRAELATRVEARLTGLPLAAVKDPRMCRLVPLWCEVLREQGRRPGALLVVRHPAEVAASLARRDGIAPARSHLLWLDHVLAAEADTRGLPRAFASYDQLLADWRGTVERLRERLGLAAWPVPVGAAAPEIETFLSDALRHHRAERASQVRLPRPLAALHRDLERAAEEGESPALLRRLAAHRTRLREAARLYQPWAIPLDAALRAARDEAAGRARELAQREALFDAERRSREEEAAGLRRELAQHEALLEAERRFREEEAAGLRRELAQREALLEAERRFREEEAAGLRREIELRDALIASERQSFAALQGALDHAGRVLTALEAERDEARAVAAERSEALGTLHAELDALRREAAALREEAAGLRGAVRAAEERAAAHRQAAEEIRAGREAAIAARDAAQARVEALEAELAGARGELAHVRGSLEAELASLRAVLDHTRAAALATDQELRRLLESRSWRLTGPLRRAAGLLRSLRLAAGGGAAPPEREQG